MNYVTLGKIINVRGLKGEVKILTSTDFSKLRYKVGNELILENEDTHDIVTVTVAHHVQVASFDFVIFNEIKDVDTANKYRGYYVQYPVDKLQKLDDQLYYYEVIGMKVYEGNEYRGKVVDLTSAGKTTFLVVNSLLNQRIQIPFISAFVKSVNTTDKIVILNKWEGLFDED